LFLAVLLGAGVSGARPPAAVAGDKIEFSWSSEKTLTTPAVERPQDEDVKLSLGRSSMDPVAEMGYFPPQPAMIILPSKFKNRLDGLGGGLENADGRQGDELDSADSATNQISPQKNWDFGSTRESELGLGYREDGSGQDSADPYARRDRLNDPQSGKIGQKDWTGRADSSYSKAFGSQKASLFDLIRQTQLRFSPQYDSSKFAPASGEADSYVMPSMPTTDPGAVTKTDLQPSPGGDYSLDGRSSRQPEADLRGPMPDLRALDAPSARDPLYQQNSKPQYVPPSQGRGSSVSHDAVLRFPKKPGSIF
jgi:hypothetical protein